MFGYVRPVIGFAELHGRNWQIALPEMTEVESNRSCARFPWWRRCPARRCSRHGIDELPVRRGIHSGIVCAINTGPQRSCHFETLIRICLAPGRRPARRTVRWPVRRVNPGKVECVIRDGVGEWIGPGKLRWGHENKLPAASPPEQRQPLHLPPPNAGLDREHGWRSPGFASGGRTVRGGGVTQVSGAVMSFPGTRYSCALIFGPRAEMSRVARRPRDGPM
jgi:hypothetical protein